MNVIVWENEQYTITARLYTYDKDGVQIGDEIIPAGGTEITKLPGAVKWKFVVDGFKDGVVYDLYDYENFSMVMLPGFPWLIPMFLGAAAGYLLSRYVKF